ncbi:hypothetical protein JB92DRAFT_2839179 [Gautieria morchelliformis]|nr:hypothetical protein JB92DRAFT_2839179 [Gautieria morchelliformis]
MLDWMTEVWSLIYQKPPRTSGALGIQPELAVQPFAARAARNDYEIPWTLREVIANPDVASLFSSEISELRRPSTTGIRERQCYVRFAGNEPIRRHLDSELAPILRGCCMGSGTSGFLRAGVSSVSAPGEGPRNNRHNEARRKWLFFVHPLASRPIFGLGLSESFWIYLPVLRPAIPHTPHESPRVGQDEDLLYRSVVLGREPKPEHAMVVLIVAVHDPPRGDHGDASGAVPVSDSTESAEQLLEQRPVAPG